MKEQQYGLYVVRPEDISDEEHRYLITPDYCLLYTSNPPPERHAEVIELASLPKTAHTWLSEQIEDVRRAYLAQHRQEVLTEAKAFHDAFRKELERERMQVEEDDHGGTT